jgi:glycosyltransferase involved in cell wall biosynthesis
MISLSDPKISVITPCFNHGKFIQEMVESVLNQTFQDFEVIIVNDGSTDDTAEILRNITSEKVKIIHIENHGPAYARNLAIENARAPIIMNLDADDKIAPDLLEKAYEIFLSNENTGIVHCDAERFGAKSGKLDTGEYTLEAMLFDNRIISQAFFKREDWKIVGGYSDELIYGLEDWDFWLLIIELGRSVFKIPENLVYYRTYENPEDCRSGRRKKDRQKMLTSLVLIFHRHEKLYSACPQAWQHFSQIEKKLKNENPLLRLVKNWYYNYLEKNST